MAQLEHVSDLDWRRDLGEAEVVACAAVDANGDSDHESLSRSSEGVEQASPREHRWLLRSPR